MKRLIIGLTLLLITILVVTSTQTQSASALSDNDSVRVMIKYKKGQKKAAKNTLTAAGAIIRYSFDDLNVFALTLPEAALEGIAHNPNFLAIENDPARYPIEPVSIEPEALFNNTTDVNGQTIPWGIDAVEARDLWDVNRDAIIDEGAPTGAGIKVCIIDTGYYADHEDLKDDITGITQVDDNWQRDGYGHGTHVAGTISALNNTVGVVGVTPGTVDLHIVKIFSDEGQWVVGASDLIAAANSCSENGADIISMSLGGDESSSTEETAFLSLFNAGILSIAAAGNGGTSAYSYPASYSSVISVAAVNSNLQRASFSQYNAEVDLAGPGVSVLSTVPLRIETVFVDGDTYTGYHIQYSAWGTVTGELVNGGQCDAHGLWSGKIVLCEIGTIDLYTQVNNVEKWGGFAALIYNNVPGVFGGTLGEGNSSTIPALSMSQEDGQYLISNKLGSTAVVTSTVMGGSRYESWSGTSMATPHVSAVAALVWSCKPEVNNIEIRDVLFDTAFDLGTAGRDDYYGYGLVQAKDACNSLAPTSVELLSFSATGAKKSVILEWETATEFDNLGFNLYRATSEFGTKTRINSTLLPNSQPGNPFGSVYTYTDSTVKTNKTYYYWLEDVDIYGHTNLYGPVEATSKRK